MRYVPLVLKNCWRNRRRTLLTVASIAVSMCLLGLIIALYHAFYLSTPAAEQARRLVVRNKISFAVTMPIAYQSRIRHVPGVEGVMIANWFGGVYKDNRDPKNQFARFAVEPEKLFRIFGEFRIPEDQKRAFERERTACVIGRDLADGLGLRLGDRVTLTGDVFPGTYEFTVRGIFESPRSSRIMYFNKEYLDQAISEGRRGQVIMYYVLIDDPAHSERISAAIDDEFRNAPIATKSETSQQFGVSYLALLGNVKMFLLSICTAVMFAILLVSANTVGMSVRERVREVGVLKTLGFTSGGVLGIILGEACFISVTGGLAGFVVSGLLMHQLLKGRFGGYIPLVPAFDPRNALACVVAAAAIGVASAVVPAMAAARRPIVEALRSAD
jgi:putative ABC transport system permease protein